MTVPKIAGFLLLAGVVFGQGSIKFEVASVKPVVPDDDAPAFRRGGPGTSEPERITYERQTMVRILSVAYGLERDQISDPSWIGFEHYNIVANVPPGTTTEQVKLMWQDLLSERFHLKAHLIKKDFSVYELSVARGGPKFRVEPGFPKASPGEKWGISIVPPRNVRQTFTDFSMTEFIRHLGFPLGTVVGSNGIVLGRVIDKTGLEESYDFTLEFAGRPVAGAFPPPLPDGQVDTAPLLIDALRQQLGLMLIEKKAPLDVLVVDHVDRVPTEN
jgi:uncharacterized protein (TIGR03435 family)